MYRLMAPSWLAVMSSLLAAAVAWHLRSTPITTVVARCLEPSDLMLTCCLSAATGWLLSRPTNSLARSSLLLLLLLLHGLAGQRVARQSSAHSIVDIDIYRCLGSKRRFYLAAHHRVVSVLVWVRHPQGPHPSGPTIQFLRGFQSTNSTIPVPTARHVTILGRSTRWHSCEDCKVIEPTQYALKRVSFFSFQVLHKTIELIK